MTRVRYHAGCAVRTQSPDDGFVYDAFISYSRKNSDAADKIERDLQKFPLTREIRNGWGDDTSTFSETSTT